MSLTPNPDRGEVALAFGDRQLILRCSYATLGKLLPLLMDAPPEAMEKRQKWLAIAQETIGGAPPPIERWEWHHHLIGAVAALEVETVARAIKILTEEHHPELTVEEIMDRSPSWGLLSRAFFDVATLFHWKPGESPALASGRDDEAKERPFGLARLYAALWLLRSHMGSARPNSGTSR